ncbi:phosphoenolpyruvate synthase [Candidatus Uabimicrobium amorphum]|uniref:Phosphoenolpyruvate synthase n=2 Tax=Uabimicrobium amorphum TaxID=2596890 RepID=A0A5S9IIL4_UABAM|nr:phosphoenolpyruvate synthase [Candidatus Uabimicrobium amorphum]
MANYYHFHDKPTTDIAQVGGKAQALIETTAAGFPVPPGFVLSVDFFMPWLEHVKVCPEWKLFLQTISCEHYTEDKIDSAIVKEKCDALKEIALSFDAQQKKVLQEALQVFEKSDVFAVRSSSPEEDLKGTSFAGGYETTLGVTKEQLPDAILTSFRSVFDARIVHYKMQQQLAINNPRIAVIVQKQIASEISGVAFSLNPQNNCYDEAVINANFGLGETVVAGQVIPDMYVVEKVRRQILQEKIASKSHALWLQPDGGTQQKNNENPNKAALTKEQMLAVTELVTACEKHYAQPMDIEWAFEKQQLFLLQSRPITTYLPLFPEMVTKPGEQKALYMDIVILTQGFSEPFSVLGLEIWGKMLQKAKNLPVGPDGVIWNIHGRQYFHLSNMLRGFGKGYAKVISQYERPLKKILESIDIEEYIPAKKPRGMKGFMWNVLKRIFILFPSICGGIFRSQKALEKYKKKSEKICAYCKSELQKDKPFAVLVENGLNCFTNIVMFAGVLVAPMFARWRLSKMFKNDDVADLLVALNMDLPGNPTSEMGHFMVRLASYPEIQETTTAEEFEHKLNNHAYSTDFLQAYEEYMNKFGCRGMKEIDIASPRSYENKQEFFQRLKHINIDENAINTVSERREKAYNELLDIAKKRGKEKKFRRYAKIQHNMAGYREHPKYIYIVAVDMLRRRALKLGEEFVNEGRLQHVNQVFDLTIKQITEAQQNRELQLTTLISDNLRAYATVKHIKNWPKLIDSRGKILRPPREEGTGLIGDAISPGTVIGKAKVLHSPYEKPLEKGEILVTRATEPSWTPIFINAAAVVLEVGGPLQHGAIIAREYGIPCVSGLENITASIKDGDELEVDGSHGVIKILTRS